MLIGSRASRARRARKLTAHHSPIQHLAILPVLTQGLTESRRQPKWKRNRNDRGCANLSAEAMSHDQPHPDLSRSFHLQLTLASSACWGVLVVAIGLALSAGRFHLPEDPGLCSADLRVGDGEIAHSNGASGYCMCGRAGEHISRRK
jgi:hypothetical protein